MSTFKLFFLTNLLIISNSFSIQSIEAELKIKTIVKEGILNQNTSSDYECPYKVKIQIETDISDRETYYCVRSVLSTNQTGEILTDYSFSSKLFPKEYKKTHTACFYSASSLAKITNIRTYRNRYLAKNKSRRGIRKALNFAISNRFTQSIPKPRSGVFSKNDFIIEVQDIVKSKLQYSKRSCGYKIN